MSRIAKLYTLLGARVSKLLLGGVVLGFLGFFSELVLAFSIQSLLAYTGLVKLDSIPKLPPLFVAVLSTSPFLVLAFSGLGRAAVMWGQIVIQSMANNEFISLNRQRVIQWTFNFRSVSMSEAVSLFHDRVNNSGAVIGNIQGALIQGVLSLFTFGALLWMAWVPTAIATLIGFLALAPFRKMDAYIFNLGEEHLLEVDAVNARLMRALKNLLFIRISGTSGQERSQLQTLVAANSRKQVKIHTLMGIKSVLPQILGIGFILALVVAAKRFRILDGAALLPYLYLFVRFVQSVSGLFQNLATAAVNLPHIRSLWNWMNENQTIALSANEMRAQGRDSTFPGPIAWRCQDLSFRYGKDDQWILRNMQLNISPGECLVIRGPSGVGKSTLLNLLLGCANPTEGKIEVTSDIAQWKSVQQIGNSLFLNVGYVGPESFMVDDTLLANLLYGNPFSVNQDQIDEAIRLAGADFIYRLPKGLEHRLTDHGEGLSVGQKQRLSLARALLRSPKALILDEATSNLDYETESKILEQFGQLKGKITLIAVTHRPTFESIADQVIHLEITSA